MIIRKGKSQITFVYTPPEPCRRVQVVGTFNDWQPDQGRMTKQKDGSYRKRLQLPPGEHRYRFIVDEAWIPDPEGEGQVPNPYGSHDSIVTVG